MIDSGSFLKRSASDSRSDPRSDPRKIVIAVAHPLLRAGIRAIIDNELDLAVVGEAGHGNEAIRVINEQRPDLVLFDSSFSEPTIVGAMSELMLTTQGARVLVLTDAASPGNILQYLKLGARGVIAADATPHQLISGIRALSRGEFWLNGRATLDVVDAVHQLEEEKEQSDPLNQFNLTRREREVLGHLVEGLTNQELARTLGISPQTVKRHVSNILGETATSDRLELILLALSGHGI